MSLEEIPFNWTGCAGCVVDAPPPDSILLIPPPPLPSFLQVSPLLSEPSNLSDALFLNPEEAGHIVPPCNPHCDWSNTPGVEFIELSRKGTVALDDTWFLIMVGSSVAVLLLGALLAFILLKCRQEQSRKSQTDAGGCRATKLRAGKPGLVPANQAHCCGSSSPHVLWAAITHKGPAHFAVPPAAKLPHADFCRPAASTGGYYGALDPRFPTPDAIKSEPGTPDSQIYAEIPDIKHPEKLSSFDNTAFEDYLYEDVPAESFPLSEVSRGTLQRHIRGNVESPHYVGRLRPLVSPPTNIASPNLPPLNMRSRNPLLV